MNEAFFAGGGITVILLCIVIASLPLILSIILFFKIWIMTNDVSKIKDLLQEILDIEHPYVNEKGEEILDLKNKL